MWVSALAVDTHWTERLFLLPIPTLNFMKSATANSQPDVVWQDDSDRGILKIVGAVARADAVRQTMCRIFHSRTDSACKEKHIFGCRRSGGGFHFDCSGSMVRADNRS